MDISEKKAEMIFGADYMIVIEKSVQFNMDWKGHVESLAKRVEEMESRLELDVGDFQRSLDPGWWPCVSDALDLAGVIENARRTLLGLMETGALQGRLQIVLTDMFSTIHATVKQFTNATLTQLLGHVVAGWSDEEVEERLITPYNGIIAQKRAIYDLLGEANNAYAMRLLEAMQKADATPPPPSPLH